jgi:hypothetical protein
MRTRSWRWVAPLLLTVALAGCGLKEATQDAHRAEAALKAELGLDATMSFNIRNGFTTVQVYLATPPTGDAATLKSNVTAVVNRSFRSKVGRVLVSF